MQWFDPRMAGGYRKGSVPKMEEGREQRKERREKREERKWPPARFPAFLQGPVATSMRAQKTTTSFQMTLSPKF